MKRAHELLYEDDQIKLPRLRESLAQLWSAAYQLPALLGMGQHWPLAPHEADALGQATEQVLRSIPARRRGAITKQILKLVPWVVLATTVYVVTYPRVVMSYGANQARADGVSVQPGQDGAGAMGGIGPVPTWADVGTYARRSGSQAS